MTDTRQIRCDVTGQDVAAAYVPRDSLRAGDHLSGPALIAEAQTTTLVGADFDLTVDGALNLILTRRDRT